MRDQQEGVMRRTTAMALAIIVLHLNACADTGGGYRRGIDADIGATLGRQPTSSHPGSRMYLAPPGPERIAPGGSGEGP